MSVKFDYKDRPAGTVSIVAAQYGKTLVAAPKSHGLKSSAPSISFHDLKPSSVSELQVSPHGTIRSFHKGQSASPSATLRLGKENKLEPLPVATAPLQHSLPSGRPVEAGEVIFVDSAPLATWNLGPQNRMRPVTFKPSGSFKALQDQGRLTGLSFQATRPSALHLEKESHVPGYTGFIRGKQHIHGRTYGETTRRAIGQDYRSIVCTSPIPSNPSSNRKIRLNADQHEETFASNTFGGKTYHVPGYTGFVPGVRSTFARSYGATTSQELQKHFHTHGYHRTPSKSGFADTSITRQPLRLDSAPLPGVIRSNKPPEKLIPAHLRDLRFLAM